MAVLLFAHPLVPEGFQVREGVRGGVGGPVGVVDETVFRGVISPSGDNSIQEVPGSFFPLETVIVVEISPKAISHGSASTDEILASG